MFLVRVFVQRVRHRQIGLGHFAYLHRSPDGRERQRHRDHR